MQLTYEEKLNLENSKEHLQIVLGNLRIANKELSIVLDSIKEEKLSLSKAQTERERILRENGEELLGISLQKSELDRREANLTTRETTVTEREKTVDDSIDKANTELKRIQNLIVATQSKYVAIHTDLVLATQEKEEVIASHIETIKLHETTIQEKHSLSKKAEDEVSRLNSEIEEAQKELTSFRKASAIEMENTKKLIQVEQEKIKNPLELIRKEKEELDIKSNTLDILTARLRDQYKSLNPDRALPIDLQ